MQRITISLDGELLEFIDELCRRRGYESRSEALRDIVRDTAKREQEASDTSKPCVATLSYVYEHDTRDLARRLTSSQHDHHNLSVSTLHVHLNHDDCLEVAILKGSISKVRTFADSVISQRGVRHGHLHVMPFEPGHRRAKGGHHDH